MPSPRHHLLPPSGCLLAVLLAAGCASHPARPAAPSSGASATAAAGSVYERLLGAPFPASDLPAGYRDPSVHRADPNATDRAHHATGEVDVALAGPDSVDMIEYIVFPTAADATADLAGGLQQDPRDHVTTGNTAAPGFDVPARLFTVAVVNPATRTPKGYYTHCAAIDGPVIAVGSAGATPAAPRGDPTHACALTHAALHHLQTLPSR